MKKCCYGRWINQPSRCLKHPRQKNKHGKYKPSCSRRSR